MAIQSTITLNNGTVIPQIGLGVFRTPDGDTTVNAVQTALENGYRHIDTAMIYRNETSVGEGIRRSGVPRGDLFVTTKLWNDDIRAHRGKEAFQESLDRLGMDYVDLYLIHWPADVWQQAWDDLQEIYASGRAKAIGVSNFQPHHLADLLKNSDVTPVPSIRSNPRRSSPTSRWWTSCLPRASPPRRTARWAAPAATCSPSPSWPRSARSTVSPLRRP